MRVAYFLRYRYTPPPGERELNPPAQLALRQLADHPHAGLAVVEAGDGGEIPAARRLEQGGVFDRDLFQLLQAVGSKAGHKRNHVVDAAAA